MKKNVLVSSNYNPLYIQYVPLVCSAWKKWGYNPILTLITDKPKEEWEWMKEYCEVRQIEPNRNYDEGIFSKVSRFFSYYEEKGINMVSDIDMLPLNKKYFDDLFQLLINRNDYGYSIKNKFISASHDAYLNAVNSWAGPIEYLKFPGAYMLASNDMWKDIINPNSLSKDDLLKSFENLNKFDNKESILNHYNNFSEESLIRSLYYTFDNNSEHIVKIQRGWLANGHAERRLDRDDWRFDINKLQRDEYIDSHLPRPLQNNQDKIKPLVDYLGLDEKLIEIGINITKK